MKTIPCGCKEEAGEIHVFVISILKAIEETSESPSIKYLGISISNNLLISFDREI